MFETLDKLPPDPILGLGQTFHSDANPHKINLSVGVYQNAQGLTPIFSAVKRAEQQMLAAQTTKAYIPQAGDPAFVENYARLLLGDALTDLLGDRVCTVMTPGGCGALRMGAEMLVDAKPNATVWVSDPTWANHFPLLESAGLTLQSYTYYDTATNAVDFAGMLQALSNIPTGDTVLLHGCCHNPTGADLTHPQWRQVVDILVERQLTPFIDIAYQGFGDGLDTDAFGMRLAAEKCPELLIASSCSKNFGLYRERVGAAIVISQSAAQSEAAKTHILSAARRSYSMPPSHGGAIVGTILSDASLYKEWADELELVRNRMNALRQKLALGLNEAQSAIDFSFVGRSKGMFCYLGIPREAVLTLRSEYAIYLLESTRINVAGLSDENIPTVIKRVTEVLQR